MANPSTVACAAGVWTKIITNKTEGNAWIQGAKFPPFVTVPQTVFLTWVDTGSAAPTDLGEAILVPDGKINLKRTAAADVYIHPSAAISILVDA